MALAAVNVLFTIPLAIYMVVINLRESLYPYRGFADLHSHFGRVDSTAAIVWRQDATAVTVINFRIWTPIPCALFFYLMFGFTAEARTQYKRVVSWIAKPFRGCRAGSRAAPEAMHVHFRQRPAVDSDRWDIASAQDDWRATKPALMSVDDGPGTRFVDSGERPLALGTTGLSAYRIERGSKKGDIVVMSPITEPPPAYARSPISAVRSPFHPT